MAVGTAVGMAGSIMQGQQQAKQLQYQAAIEGIRGHERLAQAHEEARRARLSLNRLKGSQKAGAAKAGVRVGEGSPLFIGLETEQEGAYQIKLIKRAGQVEYNVAQANARNLRKSASAAKTASFLQAGSTLLGGVGQQFGKGGAFYKP